VKAIAAEVDENSIPASKEFIPKIDCKSTRIIPRENLDIAKTL
jgi:hypothetical protein